MTHRKLLSFTCLAVLLTACDGSEVFEDPDASPTPCLDANADGVCDDADPGAGGSGDIGDAGAADGGDIPCAGDDATGDTDDDAICDDQDAWAGDDATGDDADGVAATSS